MSLRDHPNRDDSRQFSTVRTPCGWEITQLADDPRTVMVGAESRFSAALASNSMNCEVLAETLARQVHQQMLLDRFGQLMLRMDAEELAQIAVETLQEGLGADSACLLEWVDGAVHFVVLAHVGPTPEAAPGRMQDAPEEPAPLPAIRESATGSALRSSQVILVGDYDQQSEFIREPWADQAQIHSALSVRVQGQKSPFGVLIAQSKTPGAFSRIDAIFIRLLANFVSETVVRECNELSRQRMYDEFHRAMSTREEVLSIISHDLRSPATSIKLSLEIVRRALADPDSTISPAMIERAVATADTGLERMMSMMDDLLAMNRAEADAFDIVRQKVDMREVVDTVLNTLTEQIEESGSRVTLSAPPSLVGMWDRVRIEQVVTNLVSNAVKYGQGAPIHIEICRLDSQARLTVQDAGPGIAPEHQNRIFDRFVRSPATGEELGAPQKDGYGLGLWIVRRIVESLDGSVSLKSQPGRGATFQVLLPLDAD